MKITHRKKNQAFSCSTRVYLYNIESFSEAPIEIFSFFLLFFYVFSKFSRLKYVFWWLLCSSLAVDLSRSFLTYLIDFSTGTLVSALSCSCWTFFVVSLHSIPPILFNGESHPHQTVRLNQLPCSGNILHHFSFLTGQYSGLWWPRLLLHDQITITMLSWRATSGLRLP